MASAFALSGALAAAACDGPANDLLGGDGPPGRPTGGDAGDGSLLDPDGGNATALALAKRLFLELEPELKAKCGGSACHESGTNTPLWLKPPDAYQAVRDYDKSQTGEMKLIVPDAFASRLFTKPAHAGQPMPQPDGTPNNLGDRVKHWLDVEAAALVAAKLPSTPPQVVAVGANAVDIGMLEMGIQGAKITFDAAIHDSLLLLTNVKLVGGPTSGVHIVHPIFVQVPADPKAKPLEDPADSGSNIDDTAGAGKTISVGPGTFVLTGFKWQTTDKLQLEFAKVGSGTITATDGGTVGCKNVAGFQAIAGLFKGNVVTPSCTAGCHKAGGSGDGALDLDGLVQGTADYAAACNQALTKVSLANKSKSAIRLHPCGESGSHGGGVVSDVAAYQQMIDQWLAGE